MAPTGSRIRNTTWNTAFLYGLILSLTQEEPAGGGERLLPPDRHRRWDGVPPLRSEGVIAVDPGEDAQEGEMAPPDDGVTQQVDAIVLAGAEPLTSASTVSRASCFRSQHP
jgi:hypothetical protein